MIDLFKDHVNRHVMVTLTLTLLYYLQISLCQNLIELPMIYERFAKFSEVLQTATRFCRICLDPSKRFGIRRKLSI